MEPADYIHAMRSFPGAVNVVTTGSGDTRGGLTATAVMSLTADPPVIAVAVNRNASAYPHIRVNEAFCVNTLAAHQSAVAQRFSGGAKGPERFDGAEWTTLATGSPVLNEAVVNLDCRLSDVISFSTHDLFIGTVAAVRRHDPTRPLLYVDGKWSSLLPSATPEVDRILDVVGEASRTLRTVNEASDDRVEQLRLFAHRFAMLNIEAREITQEYSNNEPYVNPQDLARLNGARREFDADVLDFIRAGVDEGAFDADDAHVTSLAILGMMVWTFRWYKSDGRLSPGVVAERLADLAIRMVTPPRSTSQYEPAAAG